MNENGPSVTALITAYARAYHSTHDTPKIFDDFLAPGLFTAEEHGFLARSLAEALKFLGPQRAQESPDEPTALAWVMKEHTGSVTLCRSRYTEDCLEVALGQGTRQYVILGAGLDTFAFRRPDLESGLAVFEVDHPTTQASKQQRLTRLGWRFPANLHFVPADFTQETLETALAGSSFDSAQPTLFSWLGVTYYLTPGEIYATLGSVTRLAPAGSRIVFDYQEAEALDPERAADRARLGQEVVRQAGEPMKGGLDPASLAETLDRVGLRLEEDLGPGELEQRYFAGRSDGYHAFPHAHLAQATIK